MQLTSTSTDRADCDSVCSGNTPQIMRSDWAASERIAGSQCRKVVSCNLSIKAPRYSSYLQRNGSALSRGSLVRRYSNILSHIHCRTEGSRPPHAYRKEIRLPQNVDPMWEQTHPPNMLLESCTRRPPYSHFSVEARHRHERNCDLVCEWTDLIRGGSSSEGPDQIGCSISNIRTD